MNFFFVHTLCLFLLMNTATYSMDPDKSNKSDIPQILTTDASKKTKLSKRIINHTESQSSLLKINTDTPSLEKKRKPRFLLALSGDEKKSHGKPLEKPKDSFSDSSEHTTSHVTPKDSPRSKSPKHSPRPVLQTSPRTKTPLSSSEPKPSKKLDFNLSDFDFLHNALKLQDIGFIKQFLNKPDNNPNVLSIDRKNTLLHYAIIDTLIYERENPTIMLFLMNPRFNTLIKNEQNEAPYQLLKDAFSIKKYADLYKELCTRALLDRIVNALLMTNHNITASTTPDNIMQEVINALHNIPNTILPCYSNPEFIAKMIEARLHYDTVTIQKNRDAYKKDINYEDEWNNTLLHHATYLYNKTLIEQLIKSPIIFFKRNSENLNPQALLYSAIKPDGKITTDTKIILKQLKKNIRDMRALLFMRDMLNILISSKVPTLLLKDTITINSPIFKTIKKEILAEIKQTERKQEGEENAELPKKNVTLPAYADDDFFLKAFHAHTFYALCKDICLIKEFLNKPKNNPNKQSNMSKNTLLHHVVLEMLTHNTNTDILMLFLKDVRLNSLIKNEHNEAAYHLIKRNMVEKHPGLYKEICARSFLDRIVNALLITDKSITSNTHPDIITQKVTNALHNIPNTLLPNYSNAEFIAEIIKARLKYDDELLQKDRGNYNKDINYQDEWGNTLLHHAAYLYDKTLIEQLIKNPGILFKRNSESLYPQDLLCTIIKPAEKITTEAEIVLNQLRKNIEDTHELLSVRDLIAKKFTGLFLPYQVTRQTPKIDSNFFRIIKEEILLSIAETKHNQRGENSSIIILPTYANDTFFLELLYAHVKNSSININDLGFNPHPSSTESSEIN